MPSPTTFRSADELIAHLRSVQTEVFAALERELGPRDWQPVPGAEVSYGFDRARRTSISLQTQQFSGGYPVEQRVRAGEVVAQVVAPYGYDSVEVVLNTPANYSLAIESADGGLVRLICAVNTVFYLCSPFIDLPSAVSAD